MMLSWLERIAGTVLWLFLVVVKWFQAQFVHPVAQWWFDTVLATWEESIKSVIRELFSQVLRVVNTVVNALFGWFPGYQSVRTTHQKPSAWQAWFEENRPGTLNDIIKRDTSVTGEDSYCSEQTDQTTGTLKHEPPQPTSGIWKVLAPFNRRKSDPAAQAQQDTTQKKRKLITREKAPSKNGRLVVKKFKRNGSELFDRPAGWAVQEKIKRGFLEDFRTGLELGTTAMFDAVRWLVRKALFMPDNQTFTPLGMQRKYQDEIASAEVDEGSDGSPGRIPSDRRGLRELRRVNSCSDWQNMHGWTVASVIRAAGYEVEQHEVTTDDGYKLRMERLPRKGGKDVVFFMHGILDTSMGWVSNGVTGSQAFAAYDQGFDVWLGNSRANPPRTHIRKEMRGVRYWYFTVNELGQMDIGAQLDYIDDMKRQELLPDYQTRFQQHDHRPSRKRAHRPSLRVKKSSSHTSLDNGVQHWEQRAATPDEPRNDLPGEPDSNHHFHEHQPSTPQAQAPAHRRRHHGTGGIPRNNSELTHPADRQHAHGAASGQHPSAPHGAEASDDDTDGYASPREDLEVVSPDSSPFRAAASQDWRGSHPHSPAQQSNPHAQNGSRHPAAFQNGNSQSQVVQDDHAHQRGAAEHNANDTNGSSRKHSVSWQAVAAQMRAEHERSDAMQPDMFAMDGVSQDPADSMSGRRKGSGLEGEPANPVSGLHQQPGSLQSEGHTKAAEGARGSGDGSSSSYSQGNSQATGRRSSSGSEAPYRMAAVGHSLGGASLLIYAVTRSMAKQATHLCRLILLTPAGFQQNYPKAAWLFLIGLPPIVWALHWLRPGVGASCYIPSSLLRYITFKLTVDMQQIPALNELVKAGLRVLFNGDSSQWDRAMQMPHYNTRSMPSISFHTGMHIIQWIRSGRFQLYDYRNAAANQEAYGSDKPPDIAANYGALQMPVDIMAGRSDGVIAKENVLKHYDALKDAGCNVTYKEFDFGHLDFTFAMKDDLRHYVLSRLRLDSEC